MARARATGKAWSRALTVFLSASAVAGVAWGVKSMLEYSNARYGATTPDGTTYAAAVQHLLHGLPLYTPLQSKAYILTDASWGAGFVYPPTAVLALLPFAWLGIEGWRILNAVAFIFAALAIVRQERGRLTIVSTLLTLAYVLMNPFLWSAWANAQITPLLVAFMALGYLIPRLAGPVAAIGFLVKVFPGFMIIWAYRHERWIGVRNALLAGIVGVAITWPLFGASWFSFVTAMRNALPSCDVGIPDSIRCMVGEPYGQVVAFAAGGILMSAGVWLRSQTLAFAYLCLGITLISPDLNWAYWLLPSMGILPAIAKHAPGIPKIATVLTRRDRGVWKATADGPLGQSQSTVNGQRSTVNGQRSTVNGQRSMNRLPRLPLPIRVAARVLTVVVVSFAMAGAWIYFVADRSEGPMLIAARRGRWPVAREHAAGTRRGC